MKSVSVFLSAISFLINIENSNASLLKNITSTISSTAQSAGSAISSTAQSAGSAISSTAQKAGSAISSTAQKAGSTISSESHNAWLEAKKTAAKILPKSKSLEEIQRIIKADPKLSIRNNYNDVKNFCHVHHFFKVLKEGGAVAGDIAVIAAVVGLSSVSGGVAAPQISMMLVTGGGAALLAANKAVFSSGTAEDMCKGYKFWNIF